MPPNYPPSDSTGAVGAESHDSAAAPSSLCNIIVGSVPLKTLSDSPSSSRPLFSSSLLHLFQQVNIHNADNQHDDEHNVPGGTLTTFDDTCHPSCPSPCLFHHRFSHPLATRQSTRPPVCLRPPPPSFPHPCSKLLRALHCRGARDAHGRGEAWVVSSLTGQGCWTDTPPPLEMACLPIPFCVRVISAVSGAN